MCSGGLRYSFKMFDAGPAPCFIHSLIVLKVHRDFVHAIANSGIDGFGRSAQQKKGSPLVVLRVCDFAGCRQPKPMCEDLALQTGVRSAPKQEPVMLTLCLWERDAYAAIRRTAVASELRPLKPAAKLRIDLFPSRESLTVTEAAPTHQKEREEAWTPELEVLFQFHVM